MVRLKTRYVVVEVDAARAKLAAQREDVQSAIRECVARSHGDLGVGELQHAFHVVYFDAGARLAVVRCARELCKRVEAALVFVTDLRGQEVRARVARVCGSSRTCRLHVRALSEERAARLDPRGAVGPLPPAVEAAIATIDPQ